MKKIPRLTSTAPRVKVLIGAVIGLGVGGALAALRSTGPVTGAEWRLVDARTVEYVGQREADPGVVLSVVKNEDIAVLRELDQQYVWPWPLDVTAYAFQWLAACQARAVIVDIYQFDRGAGPDEKDNGPAPD